ncbi:hypothetical protein CJU90_6327 [Yarrowia sp. C11]|nr:hypothetical protein CJU90_6327 [Yarrowia sp. C11]KAG5371032.1 hypothetical protein CKK34_1168 [Yarrowia sp. E02]
MKHHIAINGDSDLDADDENESYPVDISDFLDSSDLEQESIPMDLSEAIHHEDLQRFQDWEEQVDEEEYDDTYNEIIIEDGYVTWNVWKEDAGVDDEPLTSASFRANEKASEYEKQQHERTDKLENLCH